MGINPSKSAHFMLFPLPSYPIFANEMDEMRSIGRFKSYNSMKTNHIKLIYVIEMAKPSKKKYTIGY